MGKAIELGSCLYAVIGAAVVAWGIWRAWVRPKDRESVNLTERRTPSGWSLRDELARLFLANDGPADMSSAGGVSARLEAGDTQAPHQVPAPVFVSAEPNTNDTESVPGAVGVGDSDAHARAIIRASLIAELLDSGLWAMRCAGNVFHC